MSRTNLWSALARSSLATLALAACGSPASPPAAPPVASPAASAPAPLSAPDFRAKAPEGGPEVVFQPPKIQEAHLPNGLRILVVERHELPIISLVLSIDRGADQAGPGIGSFTGTMLAQGTKTRSALKISDEAHRFGGTLGAGIDPDLSYVSAKCLSAKLPEAMALVTDVALNPAFSSAEVERQRSLRLTSLAQINDSPQALLSKTLLAIMYPPGHPYATLSVGTEESIKKLTGAELVKFHAAQFRPDHATMSFAGDITMADAVALTTRSLAAWRGKAADAPHPGAGPLTPAAGEARITLVDRPGATQSHVAIALPGAPRKNPDYEALLVMNSILGGKFSSRLNLNLREKHAYTYGATSSFDFRQGPGPFIASSAVVRESTGAALHEALAEVDRITRELVTNEELEETKTQLIRALPARFETTSDTAFTLASLSSFGLPLDEFATRPARIRKVTKDDVKRVAALYLVPERIRIVVVGDASKVTPQLTALGIGEVNANVKVEPKAADAKPAPVTRAPPTKAK